MKTALVCGAGGFTGGPGVLGEKQENKTMNVEQLVDSIIGEIIKKPFDVTYEKQINSYIQAKKWLYCHVIATVDNYCKVEAQESKVLEIGSFFGVVSIGLSRLGHQVTAQDIPEFMDNPLLQNNMKSNAVKTTSLNLKKRVLPYESEAFDAIIICEVLEHLNFNPLPTIYEINRILKPGGLLLVSVPNMAMLSNRIKLFHGKSIRNPIRSFFSNLSDKKYKAVGIHWREYTAEEITEMLHEMGFIIESQYYWQGKNESNGFVKKNVKRIIFQVMPSLSSCIITLARKREYPDVDFHFCEANYP